MSAPVVADSFPGSVRRATEHLPDGVDVIIVGSGSAGLTAALKAASAGSSVLVLERESLLGGTTAISGGAIWVPCHHWLGHLGMTDSREEARRYLLGEDRRLDEALIDSFLDHAADMAKFVEESSYVDWLPVIWPDYQSDTPGARHVRTLFPGPFPAQTLGPLATMIRPPKKTGLSRNPLPLWFLRGIQNVWLAGFALIGALLESCLREAVELRVEARVTRLIRPGGPIGGEVGGVVVETADGERSVLARKGVVLASGGFEGSDELTRKFLHAPFGLQVTPAGHEGEALTIAIDAGAELEALDETWWMPAMQVPGELMDGQPISRLIQGERALPHTIIVNSAGERFANEAAPYNHFGRAMRRTDPATGQMPNDPAWMIFDDHYRRRYGFFDLPAGCDLPDFVLRADTVEELARQCGIDVAGLVRTVKEFNPEARQGRDPWFNRGQTVYERFFGDNTRWGRFSPDVVIPTATARARIWLATLIGPAAGKSLARMARRRDGEATRRRVTPLLAGSMKRHLKGKASGTIGPIDAPPYYAIPIQGSTIGTVGGPRIDPHGRVLDTDGRVIEGLYAAGNAAGCPTKGFYGGAGGTITLAMTFGYLAGEHAAGRKASSRL